MRTGKLSIGKLCRRFKGNGCLSLTVLFITLFPIPDAPAATGGSQAFKAQGQIVYGIMLPTGAQRFWNRDFTVLVDGCDWFIESVDAASGQYSLKAFVDGLIYNISSVNISNNPAVNDFASVVEDNDVPDSDISGISIIWLAYASHCYLAKVRDDQYKPIWMLDDPRLRVEGFTMRGRLETVAGLPSSLVYFNDGIINAKSTKGNRVVLRTPSIFTGPLTNAVYLAVGATNVGGVTVPKAFEFSRNGVRPDFTTYPLAKVTGAIKSLELVSGLSDHLPVLNGTFFVQDKRFQKSNPKLKEMRYRTDGLRFLGSTDAKIVTEKRIAARASADTSGSSKARVILIILLVTSLVLFGFYVIRNWKKAESG
ncbi:MAG: hypothetical protein M9920_15620 [Verrucomicrobiae bacterium]|nr:hypothetical protein [Verrucomicrobiae bacterium]